MIVLSNFLYIVTPNPGLSALSIFFLEYTDRFNLNSSLYFFISSTASFLFFNCSGKFVNNNSNNILSSVLSTADSDSLFYNLI